LTSAASDDPYLSSQSRNYLGRLNRCRLTERYYLPQAQCHDTLLVLAMSTHGRTSSTQSTHGRRIRDDNNDATSTANGKEKANGTSAAAKGRNGLHSSGDVALVNELQEELERTKAEKETLEGQYRTLLDRLSEMKSKIGLKLQQDAVRSRSNF
jgi:hypothetical protein